MLRFFFWLSCLSLWTSLFASWQSELNEKLAKGAIPEWMFEQIEEDFAPFQRTGITEEAVRKTVEQYPHLGFIICKIRKGKFSWTCHPIEEREDTRVKRFAESMKQLAKAVRLPDMYFLTHIGESFCDVAPAPVFSWCKHKTWNSSTVCIPDYEALSGNYDFAEKIREGIRQYPWEKKQNKAFWRGGASGGWGFDFLPRLELVQVSSCFPELLDAKFTEIFPFQEEREKFTPHLGTPISVTDHLQYKYQILVDGHVCAFSRAYWQLLSGCVIFKNESPWYQWYYRVIQPYEHYIPYQADASDLIEQLQWASDHDDQVRAIAQNAAHFAENNLRHSDIMLYVYLLFQKYAELQR